MLETQTYRQECTQNPLFQLPRNTVRIIMMARYGMLDCANNYHGKYGTKICKECNAVDNEDHRINDCKRWRNINLSGKGYRIDFDAVYSDDADILRHVSKLLQSVWNLENCKNEMRS